MTGRIAGKIAIVTGAASGIGHAVARRFLAEGASVTSTDLNLPDLAEEPGGSRAVALAHDVREEGDWQRIVDATLDRFGGLDILVNNAGIGGTGPVVDATLEGWRNVMKVNLEGVFLGTRSALAAMQGSGRSGSGSIVNVSSVLGLVGGAGSADYSASKGAVRLFTKSVALEGATMKRPVRVNSVHPGYVRTPLFDRRLAERASPAASAADLERELLGRHPIGRLGTVDDIANAILFLASDEADFMTGSELVVDGGYTAR